MSWFFAFTPALSLAGASLAIGQEPCRPNASFWQPPGWVFLIAWFAFAVTTGVSGYYLPQDETAYADFLALVLLLGLGYVISDRYCDSTVSMLYTGLTLLVAILLWNRLNELANAGNHDALLARNWLWPLIIWLILATLYTIIAASSRYAYMQGGKGKGRKHK